MKKLVLIYGLIAGMLTCTGYLVMGDELDMNKSMIYGFSAMLIAFSLIFVAIYQYRKQNGNAITFGKAFLIGLYISLIASSVYVGVWLITYYNFHPDFMEKYSAMTINQLKTDGATTTEILAKTKEMNEMKELYKNPLYIIVMTYMEIFPISLAVSLISAAIMRKKPQPSM